MHAIAEAVARARSRPGSYALVSANGGTMSKTSVGIYGTAAVALKPNTSAELQARIDRMDTPLRVAHPSGWATIETYTVRHGRSRKAGIVIGRLDVGGARFIARAAPDDEELMDLLETAENPSANASMSRPWESGIASPPRLARPPSCSRNAPPRCGTATSSSK